MKFKKTIITAGATLALAGVGMGAAYAVWSTSGSGTAAAAAKISQSLTVTAVTPSGAGASLYPGGPAGQVYVNITNPNPYAVTITGYTWGTPTSTNTTACPNTNISVDPGAPTTANLAVPAGGTLTAVQINGVLDLSHAAPDGCQGVAFDVPLTVTGLQQ